MTARTMYWSVRRELLENRSLYIAPVAVAAVIVFGSLIAALAGHSVKFDWQPDDLARPFNMAAAAIMGTTLIVAIFYCLDALYADRRDRSVMFWKSMPVSDLTTVLAKMAVPLVILPVVTFAVTLATQLVMLVLSSVLLAAHGQSAAALWTTLPWFQMSLMLLYHLLSVHSLYYAPIFGWLLLVSAWAKRLPFVWAFVPLAAIGILEKILFNTSRFGAMLSARLGGGMEGGGEMSGVMWLGHFHPFDFLAMPGLWIGLILAAIFVAAAVRLRRARGPI